MFSSFLLRGGAQRCTALAALSAIHLLNQERQESHGIFASQAEASAKSKRRGKVATKDNEKLFENQCLERQMYKPRLPYPAWDYDWDGRETEETSLEGVRKGRHKRVQGKTRHLILVRHGQYDETHKEDDLRKLTPLGRLQAIRTGKRLQEIVEGSEVFAKKKFRGKCFLRGIHVSGMTRARETAELIARELGREVNTPDPDLNEALPAPMIPIRPDIQEAIEEIDEHHDRIERAFRRYFWRDQKGDNSIVLEGATENSEDCEDEFEIIVCHGEC